MDYEDQYSTKAALKRAYLEICLDEASPFPSPALIAQRANVSRRTFYRHFADVRALREEAFVDALPYEICMRVHDEKRTIPLEEASDAIIDFFEQRPLATRVFLGHKVDQAYEHEVARLLKILFKALIERSFVLDDDKLDCLAESLTYARLSLIRLWAQKNGSLSLWDMNLLADNVMERGFWVQIAEAAKEDGDRALPTDLDSPRYPWQR